MAAHTGFSNSFQMQAAVGVAILISSMGLTAASAQDACRDILVDGIHNTYDRIQKGNAESDLLKALCTSTEGADSNSRTAGGGGGWGPFTIRVNAGSESASSFKNAMCSKDQSHLSSDDYSRLMTTTIDPFVVMNWKECMAGGGIKGNIDINDDQVLFTLEWRGFAGVSSVTVKGMPRTIGVKCDNTAIVTGAVLSSNVPVTDICTRVGKGAVTYVVNTSAGSKVLKLSAKSDDPPAQQSSSIVKWERGGAQIVEAHLTSHGPDKTNDCCNELVGRFIVPQAGVASSTYGYWRAGTLFNIDGKPAYGMAGFGKGNWQPGDVVDFALRVPKKAMDPFAGNSIQICIGSAEGQPCMQTPNLLTLPIE